MPESIIHFTKMHGAGNDYVYVDCFNDPTPADPVELARQIADRRFGVGGDGLILIMPSDVADARMRMFNADGSESEMCGNGIRCVAKYVYDHGIKQQPRLRIETGAGILEIELVIEAGVATAATVNMGPPRLTPAEIPTTLNANTLNAKTSAIVDFPLTIAEVELLVTCVSMGNPHCICFVPTASDDLVQRIGPLIEQHPAFPNRTNVEFVEVLSRDEVRQRTWERGSGETWACGTGASAVCVAGVLTNRTNASILNHLIGGDLRLEWQGDGHPVMMTGPASEVFQGTYRLLSGACAST
ncbi:diaminopimelate epimerase [Planctomycetaceae bacterium SH139]